MTCQELDRLITPFIDDLCSADERSAIIAHLARCSDCRTRVEAESTARQVLHAHAAVARTLGVAPSWRPRVFMLGRPAVSVLPTVLLVLALAGISLTGWRLFRPTPVMAVGVIGDSFCEHDHSRYMTRGQRECTLSCVEAGAEFVLVTDSRVYRIGNQQLPDLPAFANVRVKIEGTLNGNRIQVNTVAAVDAGTPPALRMP